MAVMKIFCGCISTKSGTLGILAVYILLAIAEIVFTSMKIDENNFDDFERFFDIPEECNGDKNGTWWCKAIKNEDGYEKNSAIVKLVLNIILLIVAAVAVYGTSGGKPMFMLPFIVYEFLGLMLWAALVTVTVVIMAVYEPGGVDLSTTVSVGVIGTIIILLLFYVWLCVVSHYQILREVQSYGSDDVKVLQEWEDDAAANKYDRFGSESDMSDGPPSYSQAAPATKVEDIDPRVDDIV